MLVSIRYRLHDLNRLCGAMDDHDREDENFFYERVSKFLFSLSFRREPGYIVNILSHFFKTLVDSFLDSTYSLLSKP